MTSGADPARVPLLLFDTHTLIWFMFGDRRLGEVAAESILDACRNDFALVSAITPWEIGLLVSKRRIELFRDLTEWILEVLSTPGVRLAQLEPEIAIASTACPSRCTPTPPTASSSPLLAAWAQPWSPRMESFWNWQARGISGRWTPRNDLLRMKYGDDK